MPISRQPQPRALRHRFRKKFMPYFRSDEVDALYKADQETEEFKTTCVLCTAPSLRTFVHWRLVQNKFPYDLLSSQHHMLLPLRHVDELQLSEEERAEYLQIKYSDEIQHTYDDILESTHRSRSIPPHFHVHLLVLKEF